MPNQQHRRWKAFDLLLIGAVVLLLLGGVGWSVRPFVLRHVQRKEALRAIHEAGGFIADAWYESGDEVWLVCFWSAHAGHHVTDDEVAGLGRCDAVLQLDIESDRLGDAGLAAISRLPRLRGLGIKGVGGNARITEQGLAQLAKIPALRGLTLKDLTNITPGVVQRLHAVAPRLTIQLNGKMLIDAREPGAAEVP